MMTKPKASLLDKLLVKHKACDEARTWAKDFVTPAAAWRACTNPQWMLWAIEASGVTDDKKRRLFACWCVRYTPLADGRRVWDLLTDERSRRAVEVAELFAVDKATKEELDAACGAADAARGAAYAARGAAYAAQCDQIRKMWPSPLPKKKVVESNGNNRLEF